MNEEIMPKNSIFRGETDFVVMGPYADVGISGIFCKLNLPPLSKISRQSNIHLLACLKIGEVG